MNNIESLKQNGAILHWTGDNGFPILPDGVTVTPNGTFTTQKMKDGRLIYKFDGSTNYISLSDNDAWYFSNGILSYSFWINILNIPTTDFIMVLLSQRYDSSYTQNIAIRRTSGILQLEFVYYNGASFVDRWAVIVLNSNNFYHISYTKSASSLKLYLNGLLIDELATKLTIPNWSAPLLIGANNHTTPNSWFNGNIKDLMIFKKALTQDQIGALMNETFIY